MRLSRLYSNRPDVFPPIDFVTRGLNVVFAEITLPENRDKDTHNLGKTILGQVIDFCLLSKKDPDFFLFKRPDLFAGLAHFIEIELLDGSFVTVRRSTTAGTKIALKKHVDGKKDYSSLGDTDWDHWEVPFERAKDLLDGILDLTVLTPWSYRKALGYLIRSQHDYEDLFHPSRLPTTHAGWKPYLAHVLGFDGELIARQYRQEKDIDESKSQLRGLKAELSDQDTDPSKIEGKLLLKMKSCDRTRAKLDAFDFRIPDKEKTKLLVDDIDTQVADLNEERYYLSQKMKRVNSSLGKEQMLFNADEAKTLFAEAGVLFSGQIVRDFEQLISFNEAISVERRQYLAEERDELEVRLKQVNEELGELGAARAQALRFLGSSDVFEKYKQLSGDLVVLKSEISSLERQREALRLLQKAAKDHRALVEERDRTYELVELNVEQENSRAEGQFAKIRVLFSDVVEEVIGCQALLSVALNSKGHIEFKAEILDEMGNPTEESEGHSYRQLLAVAFDMAVTASYADEHYPHFMFHDGVFESLDDRKKLNLLTAMREFTDRGVQHIITLIDSDLPDTTDTLFDDSEIVLRLDDSGQDGRLYKTQSW